MKIDVNGTNYNVEFDSLTNDSIPLIFLHGFLGSLKDWQFLKGKLNSNFNPVFIDLVGHGLSDSPMEDSHYSENSIVNALKEISIKLEIDEFILAGYSMGARAALAFALSNSSQVKALILEGVNPGIEIEKERSEREKNDFDLSLVLENGSLENFLGFWYSQPIFQSLNNEQIIKLIQSRKENNKHGLAKALRNFSTGKTKNKWNELGKIKCPTLLISGELDKKYCDINENISKKIPGSQKKIIKNSGHNTHFENHFDYILVVNNFLTNYF